LMRLNRNPEAIELFERALGMSPKSISPALGLVLALLNVGNYARGREVLVSLRKRADIGNGRIRDQVLNLLALTDAYLDDSDFVDEADVYSRELLKKNRRSINYNCTRGAVLVWIGKYNDGIRLLSKAYRRHSVSGARAVLAYWAALGEARKGDNEQAKEWLGKALKNGLAADLRQKAEVEIAERTAESCNTSVCTAN